MKRTAELVLQSRSVENPFEFPSHIGDPQEETYVYLYNTIALHCLHSQMRSLHTEHAQWIHFKVDMLKCIYPSWCFWSNPLFCLFMYLYPDWVIWLEVRRICLNQHFFFCSSSPPYIALQPQRTLGCHYFPQNFHTPTD